MPAFYEQFLFYKGISVVAEVGNRQRRLITQRALLIKVDHLWMSGLASNP